MYSVHTLGHRREAEPGDWNVDVLLIWGNGTGQEGRVRRSAVVSFMEMEIFKG